MTEFTAYSVGSDGWFEYDDAPPETPDIAVFGWLNFDDTDTFVVAPGGGARGGIEPFLFHVVKGE